MMKMVRDHCGSLVAKHAATMSLLALAVVALGLLMGLGAVDLYETANRWVLQA